MALVYFDSSAFIKLLVEEDGSDVAAVLWDRCDAAVSSRLAYPEVRAALAAAGRDRRIDSEPLKEVEAMWESYWGATRPVELTAAVVTEAGTLAGRHALRGADAIHLASAIAVGGSSTIVAAWDGRLRSGATAAGLRLAPVE